MYVTMVIMVHLAVVLLEYVLTLQLHQLMVGIDSGDDVIIM